MVEPNPVPETVFVAKPVAASLVSMVISSVSYVLVIVVPETAASSLLPSSLLATVMVTVFGSVSNVQPSGIVSGAVSCTL